MNSCRSLFLLCILATCSFSAQAQRPLKVSYERNSNGEYVFYAENTTNKVYHVVVSLDRLVGLTCGCQLPYSTNVRLGRSQLFKLTKDGMAGNTDFSWSWSYNEGYANPKVNEKVVYALPVAPGKQTRTIPLQSLSKTFGDKEPPADYYAVGFSLNLGDTIFASRGGTVEEIKDGLESEKDQLRFSRERNRIRIRHKDNTVGYYSIFKNKSFLVEEGQEVEAGTPLGLATGENYTSGPHVRMWVQYLSFNVKLPKKERYRWGYVTPQFATANEGNVVVKGNATYEGMLNESLIVQELSKRELKKRAKKKKGKK